MIYIKGYPEVFKILFDDAVVFVDNGLGSGAFFPGLYGDGGAMLIATAHEYHIPVLGPEVSDVGICRQVSTSQVTDMFQTVGVWQGRCDQVSFWSHLDF